jgi:predicted phage terminase large subunit-like protein
MNLIKLKAEAKLRRDEIEFQSRLYQENINKFQLTETQRENFLNFVLYTKPDYKLNWHHQYLCDKLNDFAHGKIKNLMVFMPPQHGKSELVSRRLPAYMLGLNPDLKFLGASYAAELSKSFNRDCQRIMKSNAYEEIFRLSENKDVSGYRYAERADYFEIVGHKGFYKSVGVEGGSTGFSADVFSIDDPVKDYSEAVSPADREHKWRFYTDVVKTRCKNHTQKLLTMTRWHEDDLAGRILEKERSQWEVIIFPAIKEDNSNLNDPRSIGEALWPEEKSLELLEEERTASPRTFISLYQQRPAPEEGDIFKAKWFKTFKKTELPEGIVRNFRSDTAYGKEQSDNSSTFCYSTHEGGIYIWSRLKVNLSFPEFIKTYKTFIFVNGYTGSSQCIFEPKATGISTVQQLKAEQLKDGQFINVVEDKPPKDGKETRAKSVSPIVESGRVYFLEGAAWVEDCLSEIKSFPNGKFDDDVDNLVGIIEREILNSANVNMAFF